MDYLLLRFVHFIGLTLMGAGLIGVFVCDIRSRQADELGLFGQAVSLIALFYDGLVVPGALLLLGSGVWLIVGFYDGWAFLEEPWLAGMVILFAFEFIEGNSVTRLYFLRLRRLTRMAMNQGGTTPALIRARAERIPTFTHFLDLPILFLIISLGVLRPEDWTQFAIGFAIAVAVAAALTWAIPRLYPWGEAAGSDG